MPTPAHIAPSLTERRALGEVSRLGTAQLQRYGMLFVVKAQMALDIAMQKRTSGDHLGVYLRIARQRAPKAPAVPVGPVHAGRGAKAPGVMGRVVGLEICHQMPPVGG